MAFEAQIAVAAAAVVARPVAAGTVEAEYIRFLIPKGRFAVPSRFYSNECCITTRARRSEGFRVMIDCTAYRSHCYAMFPREVNTVNPRLTGHGPGWATFAAATLQPPAMLVRSPAQ
jgi:hypothetical protein